MIKKRSNFFGDNLTVIYDGKTDFYFLNWLLFWKFS